MARGHRLLLVRRWVVREMRGEGFQGEEEEDSTVEPPLPGHVLLREQCSHWDCCLSDRARHLLPR